MSVLGGMEPSAVWRYFEEVAAIPRPSYHEQAISDYLVRFAREEGLAYRQEPCGNVVIHKAAQGGMEDAAPVILQGHMDMVCEQNADCQKDMTREGVDLAVDGDWLFAKGTTLGGDDGVALAMMLAILADKEIAHPAISCVFTVSEEVGMEGAQALEVADIKGRILVNIDSEKEGELTVGCAGGGRLTLTLPLICEAPGGEAGQALPNLCELSVSGLLGGHSGTEIDKNRANAIHLLARALQLLAASRDQGVAPDFRLVSFAGGGKDNAIPREATALILCADPKGLAEQLASLEEGLLGAYLSREPDAAITLKEAEQAERDELHGMLSVLSKRSEAALLSLVEELPDGVREMSPDIEGLVQTSLNLGIASIKEGEAAGEERFAELVLALRSSRARSYETLASEVETIARIHGGSASRRGEYPAWEYRADSPLREKMCALYHEMYGKEPEVTVIHAGLECGLLAAKLPGLDAVSIGPDMEDIHTPNERLSISSTARVYAYLCRLLARM